MADFAALKERVPIETVVQLLGLQLKPQGNGYRGKCPVHGGDDRSLVVTPGKGFKCWASPLRGGSQIDLVCHIKDWPVTDANLAKAGEWLEEQTGGAQRSSTAKPAVAPANPQAPAARSGFDPEAYAARLDPAHASLKPLGLAQETLAEFKSGYSASGVNRGKLAIALHDRHGAIVGFAGRALDAPHLTFPQGFDPHAVIFNAHRATGEVRIVRDPLLVMQAHEIGEVAICFLTENIEPQQFEVLASLMDERKLRCFF